MSTFMEEVMSHLQALDGADVEMTLEALVNFPSFLLIGGLLPFWSDLGRLAPMRRALLGISASVIGILLAALFQPVWQTGIRGNAEFSLALVAFVLLVSWRQPAWRVVLFCAGVGGLTLA